MKKQSFVLLLILVLFFGLTSSKPKKQNPLTGKWTLVTATCNGIVDPGARKDRIQEYTDDQIYHARVYQADGTFELLYQGKYFMVDDTTIVSIRCDNDGKPANLSNVYTVKVQNDTLHLCGYAIKSAQRNLLSFYLDEYWVRVNGN